MMANTDFANEIITLIIHQPVIIRSNPVSTQISLESIMIELLKNIIPDKVPSDFARYAALPTGATVPSAWR